MLSFFFLFLDFHSFLLFLFSSSFSLYTEFDANFFIRYIHLFQVVVGFAGLFFLILYLGFSTLQFASHIQSSVFNMSFKIIFPKRRRRSFIRKIYAKENWSEKLNIEKEKEDAVCCLLLFLCRCLFVFVYVYIGCGPPVEKHLFVSYLQLCYR